MTPPSSLTPSADPYALTSEAIEAAPVSLAAALRRIGPGMVLASAIVGSGELLATTTLGAQVGFTALWIILISCVIKPVVQAELGRYTIATGRTGLEGFNNVPGPRLRAGWVVWAWALTVVIVLVQIGGMYGGVAQVLHLAAPVLPPTVWVVFCLAFTLLMLLGGAYSRVERFAIVKVSLFTLLTVAAAMVLIRRPDAVSLADLMSGLSFQLPAAGIATAVAVFGLTGVGATELIQYPYWCVEKGYATFVGPRDGTAAWVTRARGWVRVMHLDIACSLVVYTLATIAFYLLGAGVLYRLGMVPAQGDMLVVLSRIYTDTLGPWALWVFYVGAIVTLYGTIFASTAAHARLLSDLVRILGGFEREDAEKRRWWRDRFVVVLTVVPIAFYWWFGSPLEMVVAGGIAQALMLPIIGVAAIHAGRTGLPPELQPSVGTRVMLYVSTGVMFSVAIYYVWSRIA